MKKKILFILLVGVFLLSGCGKTSESSIIKDLEKKINNSKSYYIEGTLEIVNNEDLYTYDVKVSYAKGDNYIPCRHAPSRRHASEKRPSKEFIIMNK